MYAETLIFISLVILVIGLCSISVKLSKLKKCQKINGRVTGHQKVIDSTMVGFSNKIELVVYRPRVSYIDLQGNTKEGILEDEYPKPRFNEDEEITFFYLQDSKGDVLFINSFEIFKVSIFLTCTGIILTLISVLTFI